MPPLTSGHPRRRAQINGSLARKAIQILLEKKLIKPIATHAAQSIYTRNVEGKEGAK